MKIETKYKYVFFSSNKPLYYLYDIEELKSFYYKYCNKNYLELFKEKADSTFYDNMKEDGYLIINLQDETYVYFIELDKISNVYKDFDENDKIILLLKEKLKKRKIKL